MKTVLDNGLSLSWRSDPLMQSGYFTMICVNELI